MGNVTNTQGGSVGNNFSPLRIKAELYKWRSSQFPEEYALVYFSPDDESKTSFCQVSVNRERVLCRLADNSCERRLFRFLLRLTAERGSNGDWDFGKVAVVANSENRSPAANDAEFYQFHCDSEHYYKVKSRGDVNIGRENYLRRTTWEVLHSYDIGFGTICYGLKIHCNKRTGFCMEFDEPLSLRRPLYGRRLQAAQDVQLHYRQDVLGEPPKALTAKFETEFEEGDEYPLFQRAGTGRAIGLPPVQARGHNNNSMGPDRTHINFNGPVNFIPNPHLCSIAGESRTTTNIRQSDLCS